MRLRDQILGKKARRELGDSTTDRITCNELLDDLLEYARANIKPSTAQIWELVISANIRPFSGHLKAGALTTEKFKEYRRKLWVIKTRCVNRINGLSPGLLLLTNAARLTSERWVRSSSP